MVHDHAGYFVFYVLYFLINEFGGPTLALAKKKEDLAKPFNLGRSVDR